MQNNCSSHRLPSAMVSSAKVEYPAPTKAIWKIMGQPVGAPRLPNRPLTAAQKRQQINARNAWMLRWRTSRLVTEHSHSARLVGENEKINTHTRSRGRSIGPDGVPSIAQDWPEKQTIRMRSFHFRMAAAPMSSPELSQSIYQNDCVKRSSLRTAAERTVRSAYKH